MERPRAFGNLLIFKQVGGGGKDTGVEPSLALALDCRWIPVEA
jgi:hypothetical protein